MERYAGRVPLEESSWRRSNERVPLKARCCPEVSKRGIPLEWSPGLVHLQEIPLGSPVGGRYGGGITL